MNQRKTCAACLQENEFDNLVCINCGFAFQFDVRTPVVPVELRIDPEIQKVERSLNRPLLPNVIALHVVSNPSPILVDYRNQPQIILGRDIPEGNFQAINLSGYHAQVLGVSRQHVAIRVLNEGCVVEDLNSTNGTWLNELRLIPHQPHALVSGDLLRLGHLMIFVSFQE